MMTTSPFIIRRVDYRHPHNWEMGVYAFGSTPATQTEHDRSHMEARADARILMAYEGETPVAKVVGLPMPINVRGVVQQHGGVSGVVAMPQVRRRGVIRLLMGQLMREMVEQDGDATSTLYPFRESFYERMGYSCWPHAVKIEMTPADLSGIMKLSLEGQVELSHLRDDWDAWEAFYRRFMATRHGLAMASPARNRVMRRMNPSWLAKVVVNGETTGAMLYAIDDDSRTMRVRAMFALDMNAHYQLLEWIARHTDQCKRVSIRVPADTRPELWWPDANAVIGANRDELWHAPMGRVLSIEKLAGIGAGDGSVTLRVEDPSCPWNSDVWTLAGRGGELAVSRGGSPAASVTITALSAAVFTGQDPATFRYRGWGEVSPAVREALMGIFPPVTPYIHEEF